MDQSIRKLLKRMMHTILYKEGLKSDLSDVKTWRTLVFVLFVCLFFILKKLIGVSFSRVWAWEWEAMKKGK